MVGLCDGTAARGTSLDLVDEFHAFHDLSPYCVLAIQKVGVVQTDEKLAVGAVRTTGSSH